MFENIWKSHFWKPKVYGQSVLPDRSILIGPKLAENAKNSNATFWVIFKQCEMVYTKKSWLLSCCMLLKSQWGLRTLMMMSLRRILGFLSTHIFKGWLLDRAILSDAGFMELSSMYSYQIQASVWGSISLTNPDPRKDLSLSFFIWKCIYPTAFLGIRAS